MGFLKKQQRVAPPPSSSSSDPLPLALRAPSPASVLRDVSRGRPRCRRGRSRALRWRWRDREKGFSSPLRFALPAERIGKKSAALLLPLRAPRGLAAPPRSCSPTLPRRARATPRAVSREISPEEAGEDLVGGSNAFFHFPPSRPLFRFSHDGATTTTTTLRPRALVVVDFLARARSLSLSLFSRAASFLSTLLRLHARWSSTPSACARDVEKKRTRGTERVDGRKERY